MSGSNSRFSFAEARSAIKGLGKPNPRIYWADFGLSILLGHLCFAAMVLTWYWQTQGYVLIIAGLLIPIVVLYMRSAMFIHELAHLADRMPKFRVFWNMLCGVPFLVPSFTYLPHVDHHRQKSYGTDKDGEYIALSHKPRWWIIGFIAQSFVIPFLMYFRFLVMSPICWVIPSARRWVHKHASTMLVDPTYERGPAKPKVMRLIVRQEMFCFAFLVWFTFGHIIAPPENFLPGSRYETGIISPIWVLGYMIAVSVITLNACRTLGAHRWQGDGRDMTFEDQLLDSVNYPHRSWITELWGPIGTRFHALHHLFPGLPYHDLPEAHRRLMVHLPADSPYRETVRTSLFVEIGALWRRAEESESKPVIA